MKLEQKNGENPHDGVYSTIYRFSTITFDFFGTELIGAPISLRKQWLNLIESEKLELKGSCFYNLKPSLVGNEADVRGMLFQRHRKECEKDYTQIS